MKTVLILFSGAFFFFSCTREKVTPIDQQCTTTISYLNDVKPILDAECVFCHQAVNPSGGYVFDSYSAVAANANAILGSMKANGYQLMPIGGPALPDSTIQKISCWINQGKQDN
ncbi:MAG: hypothetical protein RLZZ211_2160 [Bacteroidota bacterium]|jgi:uncharacterized membrane protein